MPHERDLPHQVISDENMTLLGTRGMQLQSVAIARLLLVPVNRSPKFRNNSHIFSQLVVITYNAILVTTHDNHQTPHSRGISYYKRKYNTCPLIHISTIMIRFKFRSNSV